MSVSNNPNKPAVEKHWLKLGVIPVPPHKWSTPCWKQRGKNGDLPNNRQVSPLHTASAAAMHSGLLPLLPLTLADKRCSY